MSASRGAERIHNRMRSAGLPVPFPWVRFGSKSSTAKVFLRAALRLRAARAASVPTLHGSVRYVCAT
jgi:hypothetical protein